MPRSVILPVPRSRTAASLLLTLLSVAAHGGDHPPGHPKPASAGTVVPLAEDVAPAARGFTLLKLDRRQVKWGTAQHGSGAVIRYRFVAGPVERAGTVNCNAMLPLCGSLPNTSLGRADFEHEIRQAMTAWEATADIRFEPAAVGEPADLLIGLQAAPRGIAFADVVRDVGEPGQVVSIRQAAICFNPELAWETGFDGDPRTPDVRYVAAHELGHVLGLDHSWGSGRLMDFRYRETVRTPQADDAVGAAHLYGPPKPAAARLAFTRRPETTPTSIPESTSLPSAR